MMERLVGLEPTNPVKDSGFKDRCVYQFHHNRKWVMGRTPNGARPLRLWWSTNLQHAALWSRNRIRVQG